MLISVEKLGAHVQAHTHTFALMKLHGFPISCWFQTCYVVLCRISFQNYCHFLNRGQGLFASCPVLVQFPQWHFVSQHLLGPLSHSRLRQSNILWYFSRLNCFIWVTQLPYWILLKLLIRNWMWMPLCHTYFPQSL